MRLRNEAKVGLVVFGAVLIMIAIYWFLGGATIRASTYELYSLFSDAGKLDKGAEVRMAGVKVGIVSDITLTQDNKARVTMLIDKGQDIPVDSVAQVTTGAFVGDSYVEISPGTSDKLLQPNQMLSTREPMQFDQILEMTGGLIAELQKSAESLNTILGDEQVMATVKKTVASLNQAADSANILLLTAQSVLNTAAPEVQRVLDNLDTATANAIKISDDIDDMINSDVRPDVKAITTQAKQATEGLNKAIGEATDLFSMLKGSTGQFTGQIDDTLKKANTAAQKAVVLVDNLTAASVGIKDITTDKELKENIKTTAQNAACASREAAELLTNLNQRFGKKCPPTAEERSAIPLEGVSADALWYVDRGKYRFDANYTFPWQERRFFRVGAYNIGESTRLNLMGGQTFDDNNAIRYGLYASRVGIGYDRRIGSRILLSADLFRPNDPELEVRGVYGITDSIGIYGGVQDLLDGSADDVLVGIQYNR